MISNFNRTWHQIDIPNQTHLPCILAGGLQTKPNIYLQGQTTRSRSSVMCPQEDLPHKNGDTKFEIWQKKRGSVLDRGDLVDKNDLLARVRTQQEEESNDLV